MGEVITNMKVRFGADTNQFRKGMKDSKKEVQGFKRDAGSAFSSFAAKFGVDTSAMSNGLSKGRGVFKLFGSSIKSAASKYQA